MRGSTKLCDRKGFPFWTLIQAQRKHAWIIAILGKATPNGSLNYLGDHCTINHGKVGKRRLLVAFGAGV